MSPKACIWCLSPSMASVSTQFTACHSRHKWRNCAPSNWDISSTTPDRNLLDRVNNVDVNAASIVLSHAACQLGRWQGKDDTAYVSVRGHKSRAHCLLEASHTTGHWRMEKMIQVLVIVNANRKRSQVIASASSYCYAAFSIKNSSRQWQREGDRCYNCRASDA